jgi:urea carboxylase-associated protein 2
MDPGAGSRYSHDVPGGAGWSLMLPRHASLRLECLAASGDTTGSANVSMLIFAAGDPLERLNMPDTLKAQMSACVRPPMVLMSDLGRALCSVTGSSLGWHDAITGHSLDAEVGRRFGPSDYASHRNEWRRGARSLLLDELATVGLGRRDLHACVNWFSKVAPAGDARGSLRFVPGHAGAGDWVTLRAEQPLLVVLATAPHPLDPAAQWQPAGVRATVSPAGKPSLDDPSRTFRPESARALTAAERSTV